MQVAVEISETYVIARHRDIIGFVTAPCIGDALQIAYNRRWITLHELNSYPFHKTGLAVYVKTA